MEERDGPLAGVRVLDLTTVFFGPYCTLQLADMGADVIKVEPPAGDVIRAVGPGRHPGMGPVFLTANRGKRSVVIDLAMREGREVALRLAREADVLFHSIRPRAIARLGLTYEDVRAANPRIVYCTAAGFGRAGRYSGRAAYDDVIQGAAGLAATQRSPEGEPQYVASSMADKTVGLVAVGAILAALLHRSRTGEGQEIEVPMFETMTSYWLFEHLYGETFVPPTAGTIYPRATSHSRRPYRTLDGHVCVLVYNDKQWTRFFELIGRRELTEDPRFATMEARTEHVDALYALLAEELATRTTAEWMEALEAIEVAAHPLTEVGDLLEDPHLDDVGHFRVVEHPTEGMVREMAPPVSFFGSPAGRRAPAPRLGEQTVEVLAEHGFPPEEIERLLAAGAIAQAAP